MDLRDFTGVRLGDFLILSLLGAGTGGSIYRAVDLSMVKSPTYAIKCIPKSNDPGKLAQQHAEADNHDAVMLCPYVLMLCDFFECLDYIFLVLPLCEMDMFRAIFKEQKYWKKDHLIRKVFTEVLDGVFACHRSGIYHRDLKPENIMCTSLGTCIKIGDFGLSTTRRRCRDGGCGTAAYMSPECLNEREFCYEADFADIWSLGVILFNMVTCSYPWDEARPTDKRYVAYVSKTDAFVRKHQISDSLNELLRRIWHPIPAKRMSIPAIRQAIQDIDTFYQPVHAVSHGTSRPSKVPVLDDSDHTSGNEKKAKVLASADILEGMISRLGSMVLELIPEH